MTSSEDARLLKLALPALGNLVAEPLFLLADSAIVGHLGTPQLAGLAAASALLATLTYLCVFLAYGTTAAVGRRIGAGDLPGAVRQGVDGMWLGVILGVVLGLAGIVFAAPLVRVFGASHEAVPYGVTYLRIASIGQPAMLLVLASTGVLSDGAASSAVEPSSPTGWVNDSQARCCCERGPGSRSATTGPPDRQKLCWSVSS